MDTKLPVLLLLGLIVLALGSGCTAPQGPQGGGGTTTAPPATTTAAGPVVTIPPGPINTPPASQTVEVQVIRNPNTAFPYITVSFRGGYGQIVLQRLTVTVARSDGQILQQVIQPSGQNQYSVGDSVRIVGTTGTDEVVVVATINGKDYKIFDQNMPFYSIPPPPP